MTDGQNTSRTSARNGFLLGIGSAAIIGALAVAAVRYDGTPNGVSSSPEAVTTEAAASAAPSTETFPLAEHVAAMSGTTDKSGAASMAMTPSSKTAPAVMLAGTIAMDPSAAGKFSGPVTVFLIARDKTGKGHPIFAKRLDITSFPAKFTLGPADSMMGGTQASAVSLEARVDLDHDAMTKEPNMPFAKIESIAIGTADATLTLK